MRSWTTELALVLLLATLLQGCYVVTYIRKGPYTSVPPKERPSLTLLLDAEGIERVMADEILADERSVGEYPGTDRACMFGNEQIIEAARGVWAESDYFESISADPATKSDILAIVHLRCVVSHGWSYYPFGLTLGFFPHKMTVGILSNAVVARPGSGLPPVTDTRLIRGRVWADTLYLLIGGWRESPGTGLAYHAAYSQQHVIRSAESLIRLEAFPPTTPTD